MNNTNEYKQQKSIQNLTLWLSGRPCAGKSTIAKKLKEELQERNYKVANLDG